MLLETTRFGAVEIDAERIITFDSGLLGFPQSRQFALIQTGPDPVFFWLQSIEDPTLAFVVCDPLAFVPEYQAPVRADDIELLGMRDLDDCQVFVIVNRVGGKLVANLLGPLLIGATSRRARQLVLSDRRYSTRYPLMELRDNPAVVSKTA